MACYVSFRNYSVVGPAARDVVVGGDVETATTTLTVKKLSSSRSLVKSLSADKPRSERPAVTAGSVSQSLVMKSKSSSNVKKQAKTRTDAVDRTDRVNISKTHTSIGTTSSAKVNCCLHWVSKNALTLKQYSSKL